MNTRLFDVIYQLCCCLLLCRRYSMSLLINQSVYAFKFNVCLHCLLWCRCQLELPQQGPTRGTFRQSGRFSGGRCTAKLRQPSPTRPDGGRSWGSSQWALQGDKELFLVHHFVTFCSLSFIASHCFVILCTHFFAVLTVLYKPINFSDINLIYVIKILLGLLPPSLCTLPQNNTFLVSHPVELCVEDYLFLHV